MKIYKGKCPEITLRLKGGAVRKAKIHSSTDCAEYFRAIFDESALEVREEFMVVYLNNANNTIGWFRAGTGGISAVVVDVRLVMRQALECCATQIVIAHNHPSGNLRPSTADNKITRTIKEACELFEIKLLDHLILTSESYYSYADEGVL